MSERIGNVITLAPESDSRCSTCGQMKECRPYGVNGASVCYECATSTPESTAEMERQCRMRLFGEASA